MAQIYWVHIPKEHTEGNELRDTDDGNPHAYVVVSRDSVNANQHSVVGVPFTSRVQKANKTTRPLMKSTDFTPIGAIGEGDSVALCDHIREVSIHRLDGPIGRTTKIGIARIENAIAYLLDGST